MTMRPISARISLLTCLFTLLYVRPATAHDSWLIADKSVAAEGESVWLSFVTGEVFPYGERATDPRRVASFRVAYRGRSEQITGFAPKDAGLSIRRAFSGVGVHVIGCALKPHLIEMKPEDFTSYLRSERAEAALARVAERDAEGRRPIVEEYSKFAKTIVEVRPCEEMDDGWKTPLGHRLEIIPMSNPCHWKIGQTIEIRVLLDGHPWPDVPVSVGHEGADPAAGDTKASNAQPSDEHTHTYAFITRTDAKGVASIPLERAGHGFIKAHFIRPTDGLGRAAWESFWASLTFRVIGKSDITGELRTLRSACGRLSPGSVIGYRMGIAALRHLGLSAGDDALLVRHLCPMETAYTSMVDGIQIATGASLGRMSLWLDRVENPAQMRTVFINQQTGQTIRFDYRGEWLTRLSITKDAFEVEALSHEAATLPDDLLFAMTSSSTNSSPSSDPSDPPPVLTRR